MSERNWEPIDRKQRGGHGCYGEGWLKYPAVSITRSGITFNVIASDLWLTAATQIFVLVDKGNRVIGIKAVPRGEEQPDAFAIPIARKGEGTARGISIKKIPNIFADCVGHAYRAHMNGKGTVIEVDLSPDNMVK